MKKYTLDREDVVLLIIDIQERLVPVMEYREKIIENTSTLIETGKIMDIPVMITEQYPRGLGHTVPQIKDRIDGNAEIFEKIDFSGYNDELRESLEKKSRKKVVVTGMETHVCVFQTVRDLLDNGYEVFVVGDAVGSRTKDNFANALELMKEMGAVIINTESVVFDLLKKAGSPEFKTVSKLIK